MSQRIIGLGNPILTDDSVGLVVVRALRERLGDAAKNFELVELLTGGFDLLEALFDCERAILIDAVQFDGVEPGTVMRLDTETLRTSSRVRGVHQIDLPTVLSLGERLGRRMPSALEVYAIQAADITSFGEQLTPAVARAAEQLVDSLANQLGS